MKIALFSAVAEEAGAWAPRFNFTGIGRENATRSIIDFVTRHQREDYTIVNVGTVGSHAFPVGTILSIDEIVSAGSFFNEFRMLPEHLTLPPELEVPHAVLYSSDSFVAPEVYTESQLDAMKQKAQCFDMESSALFSQLRNPIRFLQDRIRQPRHHHRHLARACGGAGKEDGRLFGESAGKPRRSGSDFRE